MSNELPPPVSVGPRHRTHASIQLWIQQNTLTDKQAQRKNLRETLRRQLQLSQLDCDSTKILDLLQIPQHPQVSMSLSHAEHYHALGWCPRPSSFGIDIEDLSRYKSSVLARVSRQEEISLCPRADLLWSCKEAVFKAAFPRFKVLSSVDIFDWQMIDPETWCFRARDLPSQTPLKGTGEVRLILGHSLAFFVLNP